MTAANDAPGLPLGSITFNFANAKDAAAMFAALAVAFGSIANGTATATAAPLMSSASPAAVTAALTPGRTEPEPAAEAPTAPETKVRRTRKAGGPAEPAPDAAPLPLPEPAAPAVTEAAAAAAPVATATPAVIDSGKPASVTIDTLRAHLKGLMDAAEAKTPGQGVLKGTAAIAGFIPAGGKGLSAIPAERYGEAWDAITAAKAALA